MTKFRLSSYYCGTVHAVVIACMLGCQPEQLSTESLGSGEDVAPVGSTDTQRLSLVGHLQLPGEGGRRGLELHAWVKSDDGRKRQFWIFPDADGHFHFKYAGEMTAFRVYAGTEIYRVDGEAISKPNGNGQIDVGSIDLRDSLAAHRVRVYGSGRSRDGFIRIGLWIGSPHTGPRGELPSLGSVQFPTITEGTEIEWLLPIGANDVHFLVEQPEGTGYAAQWSSGKQQVFGPFKSTMFPLVLELD